MKVMRFTLADENDRTFRVQRWCFRGSIVSKNIGIAFALVGLCLLLEHAYTGRQVQRAHMRLANQSKKWPSFDPPAHRGNVTVADVLRAAPGTERDKALIQWATSVWMAWEQAHPAVRTLIDKYEKH
jgi:Family of unknown function (DUF5946)